MLEIAATKVPKAIELIESDALHLPFRQGSFDLATIAFGLRNLSSVAGGLAELHRVVKPGGWVAVLEFSQPSNFMLRHLFGFYFHRVLPVMGGMISGSRSAYTYLPKSVQRFPDQKELAALMGKAGFTDVGYENLTGGIAALHLGRKGE
jgi:demethylmenaquinone methyltransferase/2-methoxy-6-polyprenyl-1,4-benzoquinol methylase